MSDPLTIDGFGPLPVRRPDSASAVGELVREAAAAGTAVYPVGGGTALDLGLPPTKPGVALDTRGLSAVIDYPARDMTITVQAGVTAADLAAVLAKEGQRLPVDVPCPERATLGGAMAANLSGPRRLGRGTLRDYVIGVGFVADDGVEVSGGGRVVKNVAGYDLMKLHIGALGTLGVVTSATLKVFPKPDDQAILAFGVNAAAVGPTLDRLHTSNSRPVAVELLNAAAAKVVAAASGVALPEFDPWVIVVGFEEKAATVAWQVGTLKDELKAAPARDLIELRGPACDPLWSALTGLQNPAGAWLSLKGTVLGSRVPGLAAEAAASHPEAVVHAHAGSGVVWAHLPAADVTAERAAGVLSGLLARAADANGNVVVRRCPPAWKAAVSVWGRPTGDRGLMRTVRATLDPHAVFNPGRLFAD